MKRRVAIVLLLLMALTAGLQGQAPPVREPPVSAPPVREPTVSAPKPAGSDKARPEQPPAASRANPYPDLEALRDLYQQVIPPRIPLARFGADLFHTGTGNVDNLPMDLPVGPDYVLGTGDNLNIEMWGGVSQTLTRVVDRQGRIALPEAGTIAVSGKTLAEAKELIQQTLAPQFHQVRVDISLARVRTVRVYVVGDVERPGAYDLSALSTPLNGLYAAGGPTAQGSLRVLQHRRGSRLISELDLYDFLLHGIRGDVERLQPGDTLLVPPAGSEITVAGMVRRPAVYELKNETKISEVLDLAGGALVSASFRQVSVERIVANERRVLLSVTLSDKSVTVEELRSQLDHFAVQDGDRILISPILPYDEQTVYLEGHVFRPGKIPYRNGMQLSDVIRSQQDLLPEPAQQGEIIRLVPPDFHPEAVPFQLREVLAAEDPIPLQPFDTIRIFGRYEADPPKVTITGEILRPGEYPLAADMTATSLMRLAGGFKRSAYKDEADIASYVVENGKHVLTKHTTVAMAKALADPSADVLLKPGDVVSVRQLTRWKDVGSAVTLDGEVQHPGGYGIESGERLSSVLRRAGGFLDTAYAPGVVLQRLEVRRMEEKSRVELIQKIELAGATMQLSSATPREEQQASQQAALQQQQYVLKALREQPTTGRMLVRVSTDIAQWERTPADVELRAGDLITIPKRPTSVLVSGQVYNAAAISFAPRKTAAWYLEQAGGTTELANKRNILIVRANGSVVGTGGGSYWWKGNVMSTRIEPGDVIVVPNKFIGGSSTWRNLLNTAQVVSSLAIAARVATSF